MCGETLDASSPGPRWRAHPLARAEPVVFCLPRAGFGPGQFARWPEHAGGVRFSPLRFPGDAEPAWALGHLGFADQAADLVTELLQVSLPGPRSPTDAELDFDRAPGRQPRPDPRLQPGPAPQPEPESSPDDYCYALFGHGSAALVAYEAVLELERRGAMCPSRLVVSGCPAPHRLRTVAPPPDEDRIAQATLTACLEDGGIPLPSGLESSIRASVAEARAVRAYRARPPTRIGTPITAIAWSHDEEAVRAATVDWVDYGTADFEFMAGTMPPSLTNPLPLAHLIAAGIGRPPAVN